MACFTKELYRLLKIKGTLSTTYHPQTNGQMVQINHKLKVYLQAFMNHHQNDWSDWLPTAHFCWNSRESSTTKQSHFEITKGRQPQMGMEPSQVSGQLKPAQDFINKMQNIFKEMLVALKQAANDMKKYYD